MFCTVTVKPAKYARKETSIIHDTMTECIKTHESPRKIESATNLIYNVQ